MTVNESVEADVVRLQNWIAGRSAGSRTGRSGIRLSPRTGAPVHEFTESDETDVAAAVEAAHSAGAPWAGLKPIERGRVLREIGRLLIQEIDTFCEWEADDTGRTPADVRASVRGAADFFEFYAGLVNVEKGERLDLGPDYHAYTRREPFGVVAVITPWNAPLNQAARALAPSPVSYTHLTLPTKA